MKKFFTLITLVLSIGSVTEQSAKAMFFFDPYSTSSFVNEQPLWCVLFLPICLLNEKGDTSLALQDLVDNGYSTVEAMQILIDQQRVVEALQTRRLGLRFEATDTRESIKEVLTQLNPNVTDAYVEFVMTTQAR